MTILHLVRHGEAVWNLQGRYQGQSDSGLTERGRAQARAAAEALYAVVPRPQLVAASDLPRVRDTAAPFCERAGRDAEVDARLREIDIGNWAGRTFAEVAGEEPDVVAAAERGEDVRRGGGETFHELRARIVAALDELSARAGASAELVVFTHGGPIRVAAAAALGLEPPGHARLGPPGNCSVTTLEWGSAGRLLGYDRSPDNAPPTPGRTALQ